jgi:hypothetical protein
MGAGDTEGQRLLNRRTLIESALGGIADIAKQRPLDDNEITRELALQNELLKTQESIQVRIKQVESERKQIGIDSRRDFQRSLITASPDELLRKMAVYQMWRARKIGPHNFFALSTGARADADMLLGGEAMRRNTAEGRSMAGEERSVAFQQNQMEAGNRAVNGLLELLRKNEEAMVDKFSLIGKISEIAAIGMERAGTAAHAFADGMERAAAATGATPPPKQGTGAQPGVRAAAVGLRLGLMVGG